MKASEEKIIKRARVLLRKDELRQIDDARTWLQERWKERQKERRELTTLAEKVSAWLRGRKAGQRELECKKECVRDQEFFYIKFHVQKKKLPRDEQGPAFENLARLLLDLGFKVTEEPLDAYQTRTPLVHFSYGSTENHVDVKFWGNTWR